MEVKLNANTGYQVVTTDNPPVLRLIDGALFIEVIFGEQTFRAPIGDGKWFFSQVVAKLVDPALLAAYPRAPEEYRMTETGYDSTVGFYEKGTDGVKRRLEPLASPND